MAESVKKTNSKGNSNRTKTGSRGSQGTKKSSSSKAKPAVQAENINGRRNSGSRTRAAGHTARPAEGGRIVRSAPKVQRRAQSEKDRNAEAKRDDIIIIVVTLVCILMVLSYIGICGVVGTGINAFIFGLFGRLGYILPFIVWVLAIFIIANKDNGVSPLGIIYAVLLSGVLGALIQLAAGGYTEEIGILDYFSNSSLNYEGELITYGGLLGGLFVKLFCPLVGKVATVLILIALLLILFVLMTGKSFIMAVVRKVSRRIEEYRRRRAIEKDEQDFYDEVEEDRISGYAGSSHTVRYGVRRIPDRRMGTLNITFKKRENKPAENADIPEKTTDKKTVQTSERPKQEKRKAAENLQDTGNGKEEKNTTMYIPGVGNVRLGKNSIADSTEEEYTEKDFTENNTPEAGREDGTTEAKTVRKETTRKQDIFDEYDSITPVGVKKLRSGSVSRSGNGITNISGIHQDEENYELNHTETGTVKEEKTETETDGGYAKDRDLALSIKDLIASEEMSETENEIPDTDEFVRDASEKDIQIEAISEPDIPKKETCDNKTSDNDKTLSNVPGDDDGDYKKPKVTPIYEASKAVVNKEDSVSKAAGTDSAEETVTKVGSGAAVFTDMSKEPEKKPMPEYIFPPVSLLKKSKVQQGNSISKKSELESTIQKLQSTFESFGVGVRVTDASVGPTVTRYELLPDQGVKVKTITSLSDDIKLALAAAEIRIEAPIPGKAAVGIEVPNKESAPVLFGDLIDTEEFRNKKTKLAFAVGKDIGGKSIVSDIGDMPHALIAGATGSGKSVCINALIMSILYKAKPSDVKLIMIDPKRVELVGYNGIPHLIVPVVTDVKKAAGALAWAVAEMDDRYKRFADAGVRDLASYNKLMQEKAAGGGNEGESYEKLPQIVIIVDELNDLMMTANSKEVEADISRLTQLARACGIHVILATQRPSVNVITGTIKANIPTRIAFAVSSIVDSRTILDQAGAEKLLGRGDMLFYPRGYSKPVRLQGVYVSDEEVNKVVDYIKQQYKEMKYNDIVSKHIEANSADKAQPKDDNPQNDPNANDEFFEDAARLIIKKQKASVGMLQREFRIGFNRAARIMDKLADEGIVGPEDSTKPRKILMTMEEFEQYIGQTE